MDIKDSELSPYLIKAIREKNLNKGLSLVRIVHNPREAIMAEEWIRENEEHPGISFGWGTLQDLFCAEKHPKDNIIITNRERMIVATIIQWFGSNCGWAFITKAIEKCGYRVIDNEYYNHIQKEAGEYQKILNKRAALTTLITKKGIKNAQ